MYTYQDLKRLRDNNAPEIQIMQFVRDVISQHKKSELYQDGDTSYQYSIQQNIEAVKREKLYRDIAGQLKINNWTPCHRTRTNIFNVLAVQLNSYLLGNGMTLTNTTNKDKLGEDFDAVLNTAGYKAITKQVSYLFWNLDHAEVFDNLEFAPLYDESTAALRSGVRWWQIDKDKPLRATLYEEDGFTEYVWYLKENGEINTEGQVLQEKRAYQINIQVSEAEGTQIVNGQNYPAFPIVPLWYNSAHINQFSGIKETIDAIDELSNALIDDLTETQLFWLVQGADGMDDTALLQFVHDVRTKKVANPMDGQSVQPYTVNIPYVERQSELARLRKQVYEDWQGLDIDEIKGGAVTATQIRAAFEPLNHKADDFEMCLDDCLSRLFVVVGIEKEKPTFNRSILINQSETIQDVLMSKDVLSREYVIKKILTVLGDGDEVDKMIEEMEKQEQAQYAAILEQQAQMNYQREENEQNEEAKVV